MDWLLPLLLALFGPGLVDAVLPGGGPGGGAAGVDIPLAPLGADELGPLPRVTAARTANAPLVVIDPGHGGHDPGAASPFDAAPEKDVTLALGLAIRDALAATGRVRVAMTREDDTYRGLDERYQIARRLDADLIRSRSSLSVVAGENVVGQWDRFRLEQVVQNLLSNAIKFGLGRPIEIGLRARGGRAILTVKDHGIGIEREVLPRLFKPFERGVSERHYGGLGLGLHIVKTIVEAMRGAVWVESAPETGTVFTVELPTGEN